MDEVTFGAIFIGGIILFLFLSPYMNPPFNIFGNSTHTQKIGDCQALANVKNAVNFEVLDDGSCLLYTDYCAEKTSTVDDVEWNSCGRGSVELWKKE
jgi:hypothetical protein